MRASVALRCLGVQYLDTVELERQRLNSFRVLAHTAIDAAFDDLVSAWAYIGDVKVLATLTLDQASVNTTTSAKLQRTVTTLILPLHATIWLHGWML
jgi:hypothetical protein